MSYSAFIKVKLQSLINEMDQCHWLFTRNPEKDFCRIRKWSFREVMRFVTLLSERKRVSTKDGRLSG